LRIRHDHLHARYGGIDSRHVPALVAASRTIGAVQIQNRGVGGNIVNASPAGDSLPVLAAYDAKSRSEALAARLVAFNEFYAGYRSTMLQTDKLCCTFEYSNWLKPSGISLEGWHSPGAGVSRP
jgi:CO/xanthine dehydrogenase FAD-binding subunit